MSNQEEYIRQRNIELAGNIGEFYIGQEVLDRDRTICKITDITVNSIEVFIKKKTKKGIDHKEYFYISDFNKRFKKS